MRSKRQKLIVFGALFFRFNALCWSDPGVWTTNENDVRTEVVAGELQLKRGVAGKFEVFSDEAARIGGTDRYPSPMTYLAMAVGF